MLCFDHQETEEKIAPPPTVELYVSKLRRDERLFRL